MRLAIAAAVGTLSLTWGMLPPSQDRDMMISPAVIKNQQDDVGPYIRAGFWPQAHAYSQARHLSFLGELSLPLAMAWVAHKGMRLGKRQLTYTSVANESLVNLYTKFGSPIDSVDLLLIVNTSVVISSLFDRSVFTTTSFAPLSTLRIVNNGFIRGMGGDGGNGGDAGLDGSNGFVGYDAIDTRLPITIDNTNGNIFGGAGGGGGGGGSVRGVFNAGGGGGGGGRSSGFNSSGGGSGSGFSPGTAGFAGNATNPGPGGPGGNDSGAAIGGDGGSGGDWGGYGSDGAAGTSGITNGNGGLGAAGGYAVRLNGNSITWQGGNTGVRVKGAVA